VGYTLVANSIPLTRSTAVPPNPFATQVPYPQLDPRYSETTAGSRRLVQLSRLTITLDDSSQHGLVSSFTEFRRFVLMVSLSLQNATNAAALSSYDIIAVVPTTVNAFSNACLKLTEPGPNQVRGSEHELVLATSLTTTLAAGLYHFSTSTPEPPYAVLRKTESHQNRTTQRSRCKLCSIPLPITSLTTVTQFEIPYAQALGTSDPALSRRYRQNFLTNAREVIRVVMAVSGGGGRDGTTGNRGKGGGGIVFSSGPGVVGGAVGIGMRSPADLVNL
jgi:hypothetical protein